MFGLMMVGMEVQHMKKLRKRSLAFETVGVQLSKREMDTLRAASHIAEAARDLARSINPDFEQDDLDMELAGIEHPIVHDIADGWIPVIEREIPLTFR